VKNAVAVVAGLDYSCALLANGTVECWGENEEGQLGDGTKVGSSTPVVVKRLRTWWPLMPARLIHVRCWPAARPSAGPELYGELGNGTTKKCWPRRRRGLTNAVAIGAGNHGSCALLANGKSMLGLERQRGLGKRDDDRFLDGPWRCVSHDGRGASPSAKVIRVPCWSTEPRVAGGFNAFGSLGNGTMANALTPVVVSGLTTVVAIAASSWHTCALLADGTAKCWLDARSVGERNEDGFVRRRLP